MASQSQAEFYTNDDIVGALKILKNEMEVNKSEKLDKIIPRGTTKKERLQDCIAILKYLKLSDLMDKCSIFVSSDLEKIPDMESLIKLNFESLKREITDILHSQQQHVLNTLEVHNKEICAVKNTVNNIALNYDKTTYYNHHNKLLSNSNPLGRSSKMHHCSYADKVSSNLLISGTKTSHCNEVEKSIAPKLLEKSSDLIVDVNNQNFNPGNLWSDAEKTPVEDGFREYISRNKKRARLNNSSEDNNEMKSSGTTGNTGNVNASIPKPIKKIIGIKVIDNCKLQAEKNLIKKTVFLMSNVKRCHRNDVIDFLKTSGINVISCFPVIKRSNQEISDPVNKDEEESTMFRVCVESCDGPKMKDPEIMLKHIIVREWRFGKNTDKNSDTTNKHG
ncbi:hypothetical protein HELRODRAFT_175589 [Helobdella robusta]|uniref:Uncharacterized protein n=2 Tax=Helobdella robusta TaxID=6412 RepID=T1F9E7_HELRO|nr:hypothetical protein HELRODRAFT_175589 [Helobdella robusta]ESO00615.1 hypothetical protein HELRODRAFT_175589 [Helobdella robusta]